MSFSAMQKDFFKNANHRWNVKTGATRSGKTYMDLYLIPKRIRAVAGLPGRIFILGNTKGTLQRNIIEPMQEIWGTDLVSDIGTDNTASMFGEKVYCLGASKITAANVFRGSSVKYCYGDEVVTWSQIAFDMLKSRLDRSYSKCDLTCNPEGKLHWFKKFIDSNVDMYIQKYTIDDNPFLDSMVKAELKKEYAGTVYYDRYILGDWVNAEGIVYSMFDENKHVTSEKLDTKDVYYVSCDYGTQNATVFLLWNKLSDGRWLCEKEYYYSGRNSIRQKTDEQYCDELYDWLDGRKINSIIVDPSAASFIASLKKRGYRVTKGKNDVISGIRFTASLLNHEKILFRPECKHMIEEFNLYSWKPDRPNDEVIKDNDHCCDALRYFCYTHLQGSQASAGKADSISILRNR